MVECGGGVNSLKRRFEEVCHSPNIPTLTYSTSNSFQLLQDSWVKKLPLAAQG